MRPPDFERGNIRIWQGNCLELIPDLDHASIDALVTDPPYSSGGMTRGDRTQKTVAKYVRNDAIETCRDEFSGDNRDQRSFLAWCSLWMCASHNISRPGAVACCFTDWRQLPVVTDSLQCGGWVWRGIATWWKPAVRMQKGRFSASAEYVVYGSRGIPEFGERSPQNVFQCAPVPGVDKEHVAEKPLEVLTWVLGVTRPRAVVLDPFLGSGTTALACHNTGRSLIGFELDSRSFDLACQRLDTVMESEPLFEHHEPVAQQELF